MSSDPRDPAPATADTARLDASELRRRYADGSLTAAAVIADLLHRIDQVDRSGPTLRSVLCTNPDADSDATSLDTERTNGQVRGPLHGVPVLVKDNIDTLGAMGTTAGSFALAETGPKADAPLVTKLRRAGAVVLGKANLSEWANFRSSSSSSGWSAVGGLCLNPHALDRSAGGSSSGSGAAVAAGLAPIAVGTETDGSIVCPAALCGVVGIKPTVGLVDAAGIVPISHSQDTAGPLARTVVDAALLLGVLADADYTGDCRADRLRGARIGVPRRALWGYSPRADALAEAAVRLLAAQGASIVDPADLPSIEELSASEAESVVLNTEFKVGLEAYLATRGPGTPRTLAELADWNSAHPDVELVHFGQERFEQALLTNGLDEPAYVAARADCVRLGRTEGIDAALAAHDLDALVAPTYPPAWKIDLVNGDHVSGGSPQPAAIAGYPLVTVPCGVVDELPVGLTFMGTARSESTLIGLAYAFEQALGLSLAPTYRQPRSG